MKLLPEVHSQEDVDDLLGYQPVEDLPVLALIAAYLADEGMTNASIRKTIGIESVYECSHLIRIGRVISKENLELWLNNPSRIRLGHVRAISRIPIERQSEIMRRLLVKRIPVGELELMAKGGFEQPPDIARFEKLLSEAAGRVVEVRVKPRKKSGKLILEFYDFDDLDALARQLGLDKDATY